MEYILGVTIIGLLVERYFSERSHAKDRDDFIRAFLSQDAREYTDSRDKTPLEVETDKKQEAEYQELDQLTDEKFKEAIYGKETN